MRYLMYVCLAGLLSACLPANKSGPESAVYDFGLNADATRIDSQVVIGQVIAIDAIDHRRMRYRLNYKNPTQVFTYTQSRWASSPADLLSAKLRSIATTSSPSNCSLRLQIESFDHIHETPTTGIGVVRLYASLSERDSRQIVASHQIQESAPAPSADGRGGVRALDQASTKAIVKALEWANTVAGKSTQCASPMPSA